MVPGLLDVSKAPQGVGYASELRHWTVDCGSGMVSARHSNPFPLGAFESILNCHINEVVPLASYELLLISGAEPFFAV